MNLSLENIINDLNKLRGLLANYGLTDTTIEHPGYLCIAHNGREYYASYYYEWDETTDGNGFLLYDFADGSNDGERWEFRTHNDLEAVANTIATALNAH